ncbi:CocE/NonD family hydrolase [Pseudonocardia sp. ICBG1293]|uniref:CocE/NonD family hydrolase n=1 Tax=Pseudonocardia sp. ICBG1293 TaxID=2844382 RepID=UPI001CCB674F|nr:CocE/NonD family hydrolase [Pseudonocardia sp. ICBG1293]
MSELDLPGPDGVRLAATLVRPTAARWPAVLIRTPYGRERLLPEARGWAAHGFGALVVDVRGRGGSTGSFLPYAHETGDGVAALAALRAVPGCDGRVVLAGASYGAHCAVAGALADPDVCGVLAAVPALGPGETAREPGGAARLACRIGWWSEHGQDARPAAPSAATTLPVTAALDPAPAGWTDLWDAPARTPWLWDGVALAAMPLLAVGGTADPFAARTWALARHWGGPSRLVLGPWGHELDAPAPGAALAGRRIGAVYAAWARAAVENRPLGRGALVAAGGTGRWVRAGGAPALAVDAVRPGGFPAGFVADPDRPVRSRPPGAPVPAVPAVPAVSGPDLHRDDRVVAHTPPLSAGTLAGPLVVTLVADSGAVDADWVVRIGLRDHDLVTAVHRHRGPSPHRVVVTTPPVGAALAEGDRLRVEIAGHHWPAHARNPHTGQDAAHATDLRADPRTVHAVHLDLPHVPPGRDELAAAAIPEEVTL